MIETIYIKLEQAAEMLGTDADTLLIAGAEGRIQLYGLLNQYRYATKSDYQDEGDGMNFERWVVDEKRAFFGFIPLDKYSVAEVIKTGNTGEIRRLSEKGNDGLYWEVDEDDFALSGSGERVKSTSISRNSVFAKRSDIAAIVANGQTPPASTAPSTRDFDQPKGHAARRQNTLLCLWAATLDQAGIDPTERGAAGRVAEWTQVIGAAVSEDTVRTYLAKIPEVIKKKCSKD